VSRQTDNEVCPQPEDVRFETKRRVMTAQGEPLDGLMTREEVAKERIRGGGHNGTQ